MIVTAQLARDQKLLGKARGMLKKFMEDAKLEYMRIGYGIYLYIHYHFVLLVILVLCKTA